MTSRPTQNCCVSPRVQKIDVSPRQQAYFGGIDCLVMNVISGMLSDDSHASAIMAVKTKEVLVVRWNMHWQRVDELRGY